MTFSTNRKSRYIEQNHLGLALIILYDVGSKYVQNNNFIYKINITQYLLLPKNFHL
jgi:hypothetical protein